jgi:phage-related protein
MFQIRFGSLSLDGFHEWSEDIPSRVTESRFPRRPGSIAPRVPVPDSRIISLVGDIIKDSETELKAYLENLNQSLSDLGRNRLYLRDDNRYINAVKRGLRYQYIAAETPAKHVRCFLEFLCDDPYWYSSTDSSDQQTVGATFVWTWSITNNGKARTPLVMQIDRTSAGGQKFDTIITHTTTGIYQRWNGSLGNGSRLIFDAVNNRVIINGGNGLKDFQGRLIYLELGLNNFRYDGPQNVIITSAWTERWS